MINLYSNQNNPCLFCKDDVSGCHIDNRECLEFAFGGNDTRLFIRETSVEELPLTQGNVSDKDSKRLKFVDSDMSSVTQKTDKSQQTDDEDNTVAKDGRKREKMAQQQLKSLYTKKWSGKTYFEEELRKIRNKEYSKEVKDAKKLRDVWHQFQRELARDRRREVVRSSGPEWWQEPSRKQICLAVGLGDVITADYEEEVTGRTRQWLLDLGVTTRLTPRQVRACMWRSSCNPVDFLLEVHALVVESQVDSKKKKKGDLERPFTVNERILLSAVCVLQLPTLLTMLHYILPPPKPYTEPRQIQELLFGDLDDERIRYSSPYMEPLPFRNKKHFRDWAFDSVYTSLLPSLIVDEGQMSNIVSRMSRKCRTKSSDASLSESSTVLWLISRCMSRRKSPSALSYCENNRDSRNIFRRLTSNVLSVGKKKGLSKRMTRGSVLAIDDWGDYTAETPDNNLISPSKFNTMVLSNADSSFSPLTKNATLPFVVTSPQLENTIRKPSEFEHLSEIRKSRTHTVDTNKTNEGVTVVVTSYHDLLNEIATDKTSADLGELNKVWEEISLLPPDQQLRQALQELARSGDPLAQLPKLHLLPSLQRWLEIRNGKRILSKKTKENLLTLSRGLWKMAPVGCVRQGPKVKCSKRQERKLTWDQKKWLECEVKKELKDYYSRVRQETVDNSRSFFPTMLNHYDYGSRLNRNFRDVFFTYLPAREADTYVYRPWQPSETH